MKFTGISILLFSICIISCSNSTNTSRKDVIDKLDKKEVSAIEKRSEPIIEKKILPLNQIDYKFLIINDEVRISLVDISDVFHKSWQIGDIILSVDIYNRSSTHIEDEQTTSKYNFELEEKMISEKPDTYGRLIEMNGIKLIDSIILYQYTPVVILFDRKLFTSTPSFFIEINYNANESLKTKIIKESESYFTDKNGAIQWIIENSRIEKFQYNLLNGNIESKAAKEWYTQTEHFVMSLGLK